MYFEIYIVQLKMNFFYISEFLLKLYYFSNEIYSFLTTTCPCTYAHACVQADEALALGELQLKEGFRFDAHLNFHTACVYYRVMECLIPSLKMQVHPVRTHQVIHFCKKYLFLFFNCSFFNEFFHTIGVGSVLIFFLFLFSFFTFHFLYFIFYFIFFIFYFLFIISFLFFLFFSIIYLFFLIYSVYNMQLQEAGNVPVYHIISFESILKERAVPQYMRSMDRIN